MPQTDEPPAANSGRADAALTRLAAPAAPALSRAGALSALAELLWAAQAALVALALGGLVSGTGRLSPLAAAAGFRHSPRCARSLMPAPEHLHSARRRRWSRPPGTG